MSYTWATHINSLKQLGDDGLNNLYSFPTFKTAKCATHIVLPNVPLSTAAVMMENVAVYRSMELSDIH